MAGQGFWKLRFETSIALPGGGRLVTLHDARAHILALRPEAQCEDCWQAAAGELLKAAEHGGPFVMFARLAVMRALTGHDQRKRPPPRRRSGYSGS